MIVRLSRVIMTTGRLAQPIHVHHHFELQSDSHYSRVMYGSYSQPLQAPHRCHHSPSTDRLTSPTPILCNMPIVTCRSPCPTTFHHSGYRSGTDISSVPLNVGTRDSSLESAVPISHLFGRSCERTPAVHVYATSDFLLRRFNIDIITNVARYGTP